MCKRLRRDPPPKHPHHRPQGFHRKNAAPGRHSTAGADDFDPQTLSAGTPRSSTRGPYERSRQEPAQDEDQIEDLTLTETLYVAIYRGTHR